jgi:hypothetical protein
VLKPLFPFCFWRARLRLLLIRRLTAARYAQQLGVGWMSTGREPSAVSVSSIRLSSVISMRKGFAMCVSAWPILTEARLIHLRKLVEACEKYGVIPIISYQATNIKRAGCEKRKRAGGWWSTVANYFGSEHPLLGLT